MTAVTRRGTLPTGGPVTSRGFTDVFRMMTMTSLCYNRPRRKMTELSIDQKLLKFMKSNMSLHESA